MADRNPDLSPAQARKMKLEALKERIAREDYAVDADAVAEALIRRVEHDGLVLSACHPLFSAARRIVVLARLVGVGQLATSLNRHV